MCLFPPSWMIVIQFYWAAQRSCYSLNSWSRMPLLRCWLKPGEEITLVQLLKAQRLKAQTTDAEPVLGFCCCFFQDLNDIFILYIAEINVDVLCRCSIYCTSDSSPVAVIQVYSLSVKGLKFFLTQFESLHGYAACNALWCKQCDFEI